MNQLVLDVLPPPSPCLALEKREKRTRQVGPLSWAFIFVVVDSWVNDRVTVTLLPLSIELRGRLFSLLNQTAEWYLIKKSQAPCLLVYFQFHLFCILWSLLLFLLFIFLSGNLRIVCTVQCDRERSILKKHTILTLCNSSGKHTYELGHKGFLTLCFSFFSSVTSFLFCFFFPFFFRYFLPPQTYYSLLQFKDRLQEMYRVGCGATQTGTQIAPHTTITHSHPVSPPLNDKNKTNNKRNKILIKGKTEKIVHDSQTAEFSAEQLRERRSNIPYYLTMLCIYIICIICI